jgi:hypothetical protein
MGVDIFDNLSRTNNRVGTTAASRGQLAVRHGLALAGSGGITKQPGLSLLAQGN